MFNSYEMELYSECCTPAQRSFHWLPGIVRLVIMLYTRSEVIYLFAKAVHPGQRSFTGWVGLYTRSEIIHLVAKAVKSEVIFTRWPRL
jgi:hypothetical protein